MRTIVRAVLALVFVSVFAAPARAVPLMELDIAGGVYDPVTGTITATSDVFTVSAILTPDLTKAPLSSWLASWYYVSIAVAPMVGPGSMSLGSFDLNGSTVPVTAGMTYGTPPIENYVAQQGYDPGDMLGHSIYPTFFYQHGFKFDPNSRTTSYDTALNPGGLSPNASGNSFYYNFTIDTRLLNPGFVLHIDMYDEFVKSCGRNCKDIDVEHFAPFDHDAQSMKVPEAKTSSILFLGLFVAGAAFVSRRKSAVLA